MCDTGYVIRDHLPTILQAIAVDLKKTNIELPLQLTRCYCTALMMTHLLVARVEDTLSSCNHSKLKGLSEHDRDSSRKMVSRFYDHMFNSSSDEHCMFYVLLTQYKKKKKKKNNDNVAGNNNKNGAMSDLEYYFPGHVFVIERVDRDRFNMYQSFIGEYDLNGYIEKASALSVGRTRMMEWVRGMVDMMSAGKTWDASVQDFWSDMTMTNDFVNMENMPIDGNIHFCYTSYPIKDCRVALANFVTRHLHALRNDRDVYVPYGSHPSTHNEYTPLTVRAMIASLKGEYICNRAPRQEMYDPRKDSGLLYNLPCVSGQPTYGGPMQSHCYNQI
eukprot:gene17292-23603_t